MTEFRLVVRAAHAAALDALAEADGALPRPRLAEAADVVVVQSVAAGLADDTNAGNRTPPLIRGLAERNGHPLLAGLRGVGAARGAARACLRDLPAGSDAVGEALQALRARAARRSHGTYFTPPALAEHVAHLAFARAVPGPGGAKSWHVLDPSCGGGAFLLAALRVHRPQSGESPLLLAGIDRDPLALEAARLALAVELRRLPERVPLPTASLHLGDALVDGPGVPPGAVGWPAALDPLLPPRAPGFDVVVGNPPFLSTKRGHFRPLDRFLRARYATARRHYDLYALFIERSLELLRPGGALGLIVPRTLVTNDTLSSCRELLERGAEAVEVFDLGLPFAGAAVEALALFARRRAGRARTARVDWRPAPWPGAAPRSSPQRAAGRQPPAASLPLGDVLALRRGIEAGKLDARLLRPGDVAPAGARPVLRGEDVGRFAIWPAGFAALPDWSRPILWKAPALYASPKLVIRRVASSPVVAVERADRLVLNVLYCGAARLAVDPDTLAAWLMSPAVASWLRRTFRSDDRLFPYLRAGHLERIPVPEALVRGDAPWQAVGGAARAAAQAADELWRHACPARAAGAGAAGVPRQDRLGRWLRAAFDRPAAESALRRTLGEPLRAYREALACVDEAVRLALSRAGG